MNRHSSGLIVNGVLAAVMLVWLVLALQLPYITNGQPGPGFFPVWLSVIGLVLALAPLATDVHGRLRKSIPRSSHDSEGSPVQARATASSDILESSPPPAEIDREAHASSQESSKGQLGRLLGALLGVMAFFYLIPVLGFIVGLTIYLLYLTSLVLRMEVRRAVVVSMATMAFIYLVFSALLNVPFPTGMVGI